MENLFLRIIRFFEGVQVQNYRGSTINDHPAYVIGNDENAKIFARFDFSDMSLIDNNLDGPSPDEFARSAYV